jgi:hypothetical protein
MTRPIDTPTCMHANYLNHEHYLMFISLALIIHGYKSPTREWRMEATLIFCSYEFFLFYFNYMIDWDPSHKLHTRLLNLFSKY